jgi:hypothetical protein
MHQDTLSGSGICSKYTTDKEIFDKIEKISIRRNIWNKSFFQALWLRLPCRKRLSEKFLCLESPENVERVQSQTLRPMFGGGRQKQITSINTLTKEKERAWLTRNKASANF